MSDQTSASRTPRSWPRPIERQILHSRPERIGSARVAKRLHSPDDRDDSGLRGMRPERRLGLPVPLRPPPGARRRHDRVSAPVLACDSANRSFVLVPTTKSRADQTAKAGEASDSSSKNSVRAIRLVPHLKVPARQTNGHTGPVVAIAFDHAPAVKWRTRKSQTAGPSAANVAGGLLEDLSRRCAKSP